MVKKYSPTVDSSDKPIMKTDSDGHFVHVDDYDKAVKVVSEFYQKLEGIDPSVLTVKRFGIIEDLRKALESLK